MVRLTASVSVCMYTTMWPVPGPPAQHVPLSSPLTCITVCCIPYRCQLSRPIASIFMYVPQCVRDAIYNRVASLRYVMFGKKEECPMPTKLQRMRFIDWKRHPLRATILAAAEDAAAANDEL
jgi:hypothetical protein